LNSDVQQACRSFRRSQKGQERPYLATQLSKVHLAELSVLAFDFILGSHFFSFSQLLALLAPSSSELVRQKPSGSEWKIGLAFVKLRVSALLPWDWPEYFSTATK